MEKIVIPILMSFAGLAVVLFAWFVWPKSYTEENAVRTRRLTGTRYVWSEKQRDWITESDKKTYDLAEDEERRNKAKPVLDALSQIVIERDDGDADRFTIQNPSHWILPQTEVTVQYHRQSKGRLVLLKIVEDTERIDPGMNDIYLRDANHLVGTEPLIESIKITGNLAQRAGGDGLQTELVPAFVFEHKRTCKVEYTKNQTYSENEFGSSDSEFYYTSKVVCRSYK